MAVRIDIRPRLVLRDEPVVTPRRRWRMPPLALPAAGYWVAMAGLTYFFSNLGANPLESALSPEPADVSEPSLSPAPASAPALVSVPDLPLAAASPPSAQPAPSEPSPSDAVATADDTVARDSEPTEPPRRHSLSSSRNEPRERDESPERDEPEPRLARSDEPAPRLEFPEFTDSSRPTRRERASDGPRLDALFERRDDAPGSREPAPAPAPDKPPETTRDAPTSVSSCEAAIARNNEQISIGGARGPADISREQYAGILQNGRYLSGCSIPERTVFEICAAVRDGRAVGITVTSAPPSPSLNACVRRVVSSLKFPASPRLDVTHTRFDAARR